MIETEQRLQRAAELMAERERHRVSEGDREGALRAAAERGLDLSGEQRAAFDRATDGRDLSVVAEGLENGSGIASRTLASMEHGWSQGRDLLTERDVLVIDEAGMVGTRQIERVLSHAADAGAKVVLVVDAEQLQSIEAGASDIVVPVTGGEICAGRDDRPRLPGDGRHAAQRDGPVAS